VLRRLRIENLVLIREAELSFGPGLNAVTGETGAGKAIFAQAIGLLQYLTEAGATVGVVQVVVGVHGDAAYVGPDGTEAYVEAELDVPDGFFDEDDVAALAELRPEGEAGLVIARRVFGDGRTRAYAWGRAVAREDVAVAAERLIAMSGQFEQRRLARPAFQLDVLDAYCGAEQVELRRQARLSWQELGAARRRYEELTRDADAVAFRFAELQALVEATEGMAPADEEELLGRRERLRHVEELAEAANAAASAIAPDEGEGAASLAARAERALAPMERFAPELAPSVEELRDLAVRLGELGSDLYRFVATVDAGPGELEGVEERLQAIADLKRRFAAASYDELLELAAAAERELGEAPPAAIRSKPPSRRRSLPSRT
jgi:DNA repair protein RecN (Recombination protein N)